jgi:hypothetical protein
MVRAYLHHFWSHWSGPERPQEFAAAVMAAAGASRQP